MARYTGPVCRLCRTEQKKLFLKGERCKSDKCPLNKKRGAPGKDPKGRAGKRSEYGLQLREKQKLKRTYGMLEKQFRLTFARALRMPGITGENLIQLLECRLDNVVFRMHFASSRNQARQLVSHGHFTVNGVKVNIPSYLTKVNDVIKVKEASANSEIFKAIVEATENGRPVPTWLEADLTNKTGKVVALPAREEIDLPRCSDGLSFVLQR